MRGDVMRKASQCAQQPAGDCQRSGPCPVEIDALEAGSGPRTRRDHQHPVALGAKQVQRRARFRHEAGLQHQQAVLVTDYPGKGVTVRYDLIAQAKPFCRMSQLYTVSRGTVAMRDDAFAAQFAGEKQLSLGNRLSGHGGHRVFARMG